LNCYFSNNNQYYTSNQYLTGSVVTTGIARYNNKFDFTLYQNGDNYTFSLIPKATATFSFSVVMDGSFCPKLVTQNAFTSGCSVTLFYAGTEPVTLVGSKYTTPLPVVFTHYSSTMDIQFDTWNVYASTKSCFILDCAFTDEWSTVQLITPNVQIVTAADKSLEAQVDYSVGNVVAGVIQQMNGVLDQLNQANANISALKKQLSTLNFNVTYIQYQNFSAMRAEVQSLIDAIPSDNSTDSDTGPSGSSCGGGVWGSAVCWFQEFASTLITVAICVGVAIVCYVVCFRMGVAKKLFSFQKGGGKKNVAMSEYNAD